MLRKHIFQKTVLLIFISLFNISNLFGQNQYDTLFIKDLRERYDGVVTMYHDQGHIPFKMLAFDSGVNSTLGLPIIRTSVDHGTAFDIPLQCLVEPAHFTAIQFGETVHCVWKIRI